MFYHGILPTPRTLTPVLCQTVSPLSSVGASVQQTKGHPSYRSSKIKSRVHLAAVLLQEATTVETKMEPELIQHIEVTTLLLHTLTYFTVSCHPYQTDT